MKAHGIFVLLVSFAFAPLAAAQERATLDDFDSVAAWEARASDGVNAGVSPADGVEGPGLKLDFDFHDVSGYALARRALPLDFPENFEISFWIRAEAPVNTLEFKLVDASGQNVWWRTLPDYAFPNAWTKVRIRSRQISFAWGPATDHALAQTASIEFVVSRGAGGGAGSVYIDGLEMRALPVEGGALPTPRAVASAALRGAAPALALDGDASTAWRARAGRRNFTIDLGAMREFGGVELAWGGGAYASDYDVLLSEDGRDWTRARHVVGADGGRDSLLMTDAEARFVRFEFERGPGRLYELRDVAVKAPEWGADRNAFIEALAGDAPRGTYPRSFVEQSYWTLIGADGAADSALMSEDGALEVGKGAFSVEPFVRVGGRLLSWADVESVQSLEQGYLPIPSVVWSGADWSMRTTAFVDGDAANSSLVTRYDVANTSVQAQNIELVLALRPFQVNGPRQVLNVKGGVSPIEQIEVGDAGVAVNGRARVIALTAPTRAWASAFDAGLAPVASASPTQHARDETGFGSATLTYVLDLAPGESRTVAWTAPLTGAPVQIGLADLDLREARVASDWRARLDRVDIRVPDEGRVLVDTLRTSLAHILMSRQGPVLQPGTRSYDRAWIRDGAMIADGLIRLGSPDVAADFLRWYAPYQFENGKAPCCVDRRGADPVAENDSHGEFIFLAAEVWRATQDEALLRELWPQIESAVAYMDALRASEMEKNAAPERRHLYGLLPPSISHEGYSSNPAYSYWDDFWALLGYKEAVGLAEVLGEREAAAHIAASRDSLRRDLYASLAAMRRVHGVDFIPGAADLGDFDATSTTIALTPAGEWENLPPAALEATFERYWREFEARRDGARDWDAYTPYEIRNVGAFVRLGWRERAYDLMQYFLNDRRPDAWNGWAEVVGRDARAPRFIGDMPHAWISSDYIRAALDMFAYARDSDQTLVLAAGVPQAWLDGEGIAVRGLNTPYGTLAYSLKRDGRRLVLDIAGDAPPGGFVLPWPYADPPRGRRLQGRELVIERPGRVTVSLR